MKEANEQLKKALASMQNGILDLWNLNYISLNKVFNFLQDSDIDTNKITSIDISDNKN